MTAHAFIDAPRTAAFERDLAPKHVVVRQLHHAHAARAQTTSDAVARGTAGIRYECRCWG